MTPSPTALVLAAVLLTTACADDRLTQVEADPIRAHSPGAGTGSAQISTAAVPDYALLDGATATGTSGSLHLSVDTDGSIPRFPDSFIESVPVFGYAWVDLATAKGVVAVIHPSIPPDSRQNPNGWHTHPVQLSEGTASSDFCLASIGTSQGGINIHDDVLRLQIAERQAGFPASAIDAAVAFIVRADAGCGSGLGVEVLSTQPL